MNDITRKQSSSAVQIVGGDQQYIADVVLDRGFKKLVIKSDSDISSTLKIHQEYDVDEDLDDVNYYVVYSRNGESTISGFTLRFNDKKVWVKLVIDGVEIFDINCEELKDMSDWNAFPQPQTYVSWNDNKELFFFTPSFPMVAASSVSIEARSKTGQNKKYRAGIIQVSEQ